MTGLGNITGGVRIDNPTTGGKSSTVLQEYMSQLKCNQIIGLQKRYWSDLILFQYNMDLMLEWANGGYGCHHNEQLLSTNNNLSLKVDKKM